MSGRLGRRMRHLVARSHRPPRAEFNRTNRSLPEADKWDLSDFVVRTLIPIVGVHPYPVDELLLMCSAIAYFEPAIIIEWGTSLGLSGRVFYETVRYLGRKTPIHTIDLPPDLEHPENVRDPRERGKYVRDTPVQRHQGDGLTTALELLAQAGTQLPLVFLDGDHTYETVDRELRGLKQAASQAVLLVHDTFCQGSEANYNVGPYRALAEFAAENKLPVHSTVLGLPGMSLTYWP